MAEREFNRAMQSGPFRFRCMTSKALRLHSQSDSFLHPMPGNVTMEWLCGAHILVLADDDWEGTPSHRQKWALQWARAGNQVLWIEPPTNRSQGRYWQKVFRSFRPTLRNVQENIWVGSSPPNLPLAHSGTLSGRWIKAIHNIPYLSTLRRHLNRLRREIGFDPNLLVLFQQIAYRWNLVAKIPHQVSIYYNIDLFNYGAATIDQLAEEQVCAETVDVIFATSEANRKRLLPFNPHTFHIAHAVDRHWWDEFRANVAPEYDSIPRPRVVMPAYITPKVDLELLRQVVIALPSVQFVMMGHVAAAVDTLALETLSQHPNFHLLGPRPLNSIPGYMAGADILMFAYKRTENTAHAGLALKFYEYLITGKPVVTTEFVDFESEDVRLFHICPKPEDWIREIPKILENPEREQSLEGERIERALHNTYDQRLEEQRAALREVFGEPPSVRRISVP